MWVGLGAAEQTKSMPQLQGVSSLRVSDTPPAQDSRAQVWVEDRLVRRGVGVGRVRGDGSDQVAATATGQEPSLRVRYPARSVRRHRHDLVGGIRLRQFPEPDQCPTPYLWHKSERTPHAREGRGWGGENEYDDSGQRSGVAVCDGFPEPDQCPTPYLWHKSEYACARAL